MWILMTLSLWENLLRVAVLGTVVTAKLHHFFELALQGEVVIRPETYVPIRPITRSGQIFQFLQKVIFAELTFIIQITPKFRGGNDFYKTNHSKIHEIRPITPKSTG